MVKQFVCPLKGNTFDWYTNLEPASRDSWAQLESKFLNRFFSTKRTISMMTLTTTKVRTLYSSSLLLKARYEPRKPNEASKLEKKEAHDVTSEMTKFSFRTKKVEGGLDPGNKEHLTLKEMQEKDYPLP
ncbi:hypothetical protein LIER_00205 [Lithospermum erythrorhizon]|uniref:Retrotransposon gag domain-containing protein n=1 Tax=Lithospermum erythrorhizon TaxID=34254 RepID=A0AAV3NGN1_LITER